MKTLSIRQDCVANRIEFSEPFPYAQVYADLDGEDASEQKGGANQKQGTSEMLPGGMAEMVPAIRALVVDHLVRRNGTGGAIAVRATTATVVMLAELVSPSGKSLRVLSRELGVTPAFLSRIGLRLAAQLNLRAPWQRHELRKQYSERQRAVAAGVHTPTPKWERDRFRIKRAKRRAVKTARNKTKK